MITYIIYEKSTGDFSVTIRDISKDKYRATVVKRAVKSIHEAIIEGLPEDATVLESVLDWRLVSEADLAASESPEGILVSQGTAEWVINRRSIPAGIYQVKFNASITVGGPGSPQTLTAFDFGFIRVVTAPVRAIIDGGSSVRWGTTETVTVDGSLSYDADLGPGNHTGLIFTWSCRDSAENSSMSNDCFGAFLAGGNAIVVNIDPSVLSIGKTYVLRLNVSKDERSAATEMLFEIADGEMPQVTLR